MSCDSSQNAAAAGGTRNGITKLASKAAYGAGAGLSTWAGWNAGAAVGGVVGAGFFSSSDLDVMATGALMGAAAGGTVGAIQARRAFDNAVTSRRRKAEAKAWKNRDIEAENRHIAEAKAQGRFYDNLNRRTTSTKYIVAGVIEGDQFKDARGQAPVDKMEFYDYKEAASMALGAGYSLWEVTANKPADSSNRDDPELKELLILEQSEKADYQTFGYDTEAGDRLTDKFKGTRLNPQSLQTAAGKGCQIKPLPQVEDLDDMFLVDGPNGHIYYSMPNNKDAKVEAIVPRSVCVSDIDKSLEQSRQQAGPTITYNITNMETGETFISSEEPYGRRPEPDSSGGTMMEAERPEADQFHEIVDTRSNRVELE